MPKKKSIKNEDVKKGDDDIKKSPTPTSKVDETVKEELEKIAEGYDEQIPPEQPEKKQKRSYTSRKKKKADTKDYSELIILFSPSVSTLVNIAFTRLKWEKLTTSEEKLLTDAVLQVGYKYLPMIFEKFGEEINLAFVIACILLPRLDNQVKKDYNINTSSG